MAKRKRSVPEPASNKKRLKGASPRKKHSHGDIDPDRDYKVKSIVDETDTRYLISWEDDEITGEKYANTWEPKRNANQLAVDDWERQKAAKNHINSRDNRKKEGLSSNPRITSPTPSPRKPTSLRRGRRIIDSSPSIEEPAPPNGFHAQSQASLEIDESQPEASTPRAEPWHLNDKQTAAAVQPGSPPSSYHAGEYQKIPHSQIAARRDTQSGTSPEPVQYLSTAPDNFETTEAPAEVSATPGARDHQPLATPPGPEGSAVRIIPDSQTLHESTSLGSPTQTNLTRPHFPTSQPLEFSPSSKETAAEAQSDAATHSRPSIDYSNTGQPTFSSAGHPTSIAGAAEEDSAPLANGSSAFREKSPFKPQSELSPSIHSESQAEVSVNPPENVIQNTTFQNSTVLDLPTQFPSQHQDNVESVSQPSILPPASAAAHVDLTRTQQQPSSLSKFTVTPPPRATRAVEDQQTQRQGQTWESSFLLQTQLSQGFGSNRATSVPAARSSAPVTSSPITPVPSQSIIAPRLGGSAPSRPPTFSTPPSGRMETSQKSTPAGSPLGFAAQMKAKREELRLKRASQNGSGSSAAMELPTGADSSTQMAETKPRSGPALGSPFLFAQAGARSPSAVPAEEPLPVITLEEMNTSGRYETLFPQAHTENSEVPPSHEPASTNATNEPTDNEPLDFNTHAVPVYLIGHQRDQYVTTVYYYKAMVHRFLANRHPDEALMQEAMHFVERVRHVTVHPDLDNAETYTQFDVPANEQIEWDTRCSAKFRFLRDLFGHLQGAKLCIAIIATPGRILDILETFLKGINIKCHRNGSQAAPNAPDGGITALLLASDSENDTKLCADLVIAFDTSVDCDAKQFRDLRRTGDVPFISLIVPRSVEHVERCISARLPASAHLRALVSGIYQYRDEAGKSEGGVDSPKPNPFLIAEYLKGGGQQNWPLPPLLDLKDFDSQTDSEIGEAGAEHTTTIPTGEKRSRESEDADMNGIASSKRSRVESPAIGTPPVTQHNEGDTTHISDSIEKMTQSTSQIAETGPGPVLTPNELRLQELLVERQDRLDELAKVLADLQFRSEEQRTKLLEVTTERDRAIETAQTAILRLTEESEKMSKLRAENSNLKEQLKEANARLLNHSVPERAELETVRQAQAQANVDREKAEKRLEQANKDLAYVRDLYQSASNSAQSSAVQVVELEGRLATAEAKATGEHARLRQIGFDEFTNNLRNDVHRLKAVVKERDAALKASHDELMRLKEASRGRMGTRGTSLPRSPRLGSPKPGSRQTSPSTAEGKVRAMGLHPLRNG